MKKVLFFLLLVIPAMGYAQFDEQFYAPVKEWRANNLPVYEQVWVMNGADSVNAVWCKPVAEIAGVVFFCHGNYGNISYNDEIIRTLVEGGFAVFTWDYPGFGYSTGNPTHIGIADMGQRTLDVLLARNDVKDKKVILFGFSIGCQVVAKLARNNQTKVAALVLDAGMKSFTEMALRFAPEEAHSSIRQYVTFPYSAIEDISYLEDMPKLIMHSREDNIAPIEHSEAVYEQAALPKVFFEYSGGHISALIGDEEETLQLFRELIR